mgnify:CR=1 FL=1
MKRYPFSTMFCGRHLRICDPIAPAVAEAGERSFDFEVSLNNGWDSQNCEFVIYVFKEEEDAAFIVNNGAVCPVGGKVDYKYESVE